MKQLNTVAIVGVGFIGGSIGMAVRKRGLAERVIGIGHRQESLRTARRVGAVNNTTVDLAKGVAEADLVIVCTSVGRVVDDVRRVAENCPPDTLITDSGSTKSTIVETFNYDTDNPTPEAKLPRGCRFLGSHPLAGGEKIGPAHASADLFEGRVTVVTPTKNTLAEDFDLLETFWTALGSMVVKMSAADHDKAVAMTSHLPHAVAAVLACSVPEEFFRLISTGFLDTTRIAAGGPEIWKHIFDLNRDNILAALSHFGRNLASLETAIRNGDEAMIERILTLAKNNRDALGS
ncbi:MAG: prephenate dehydrogenase [Pirellulales bacterium]|nr:prephenate dehydrogenase [Pirellulales bacterium]